MGRLFKLNLLMVILGCGILVTQAGSEEHPVLKTQKDRFNYAIGVNLVNNLKQQGVEIDPDIVMKGMKDAFSGGTLLMTDEELRKNIYLYQTEVRKNHEKARAKKAAEGKKKDAGSVPGGK